MAPGTPNSFGDNARHNVAGRVPLAFALVNRFQRSEDQAVVRRAAAGERKAGNREGAEHIGIGPQDLFRLLGDVRGVRERRSRRCLHDHDEVVLVFLRNEAGGNVNDTCSRSRPARRGTARSSRSESSAPCDDRPAIDACPVRESQSSMPCATFAVSAREPSDVSPIERPSTCALRRAAGAPPAPATASAH